LKAEKHDGNNQNRFHAGHEEFDKAHFTNEEIAESDLEAELIMALIDARESQGVSQRSLEELSGIRQPAIARIERGTNSPTVETLIRLLAPLGKKLAIVPISASENQRLSRGRFS
jgi:ribosome-binding protein aMBF1 (putative translation factor)